METLLVCGIPWITVGWIASGYRRAKLLFDGAGGLPTMTGVLALSAAVELIAADLFLVNCAGLCPEGSGGERRCVVRSGPPLNPSRNYD